VIVGIAGKKRAGKDTVASILQAKDPDQVRCIHLADPIKHAVRSWFGWTSEHTDGHLKETVDPRWLITPRLAMQLLGTDVARQLHPDIWVRCALARVAIFGNRIVLIPDVRFTNEARAIRQEGGLVLRIYRDRTDRHGDEHPSEMEMDSPEFASLVTHEIRNNTDELSDLRAKVQTFWREIQCQGTSSI
jgi:hypothetical protein